MEPIIHTCRTHFWHLFHPTGIVVGTPRALVMDERTLKSVSLTVTQAENLVCEVCANLRIQDLPKTPRMQHTSAIFYIEPTADNIAVLQKELSRNNLNLLHFKEYHIVFTRNVDQAMIEQLARCDTHSKIVSLRVIYGDFMPTGVRTYTFSRHPLSITSANSKNRDAEKKNLILHNEAVAIEGISGLTNFIQKRKDTIRKAITLNGGKAFQLPLVSVSSEEQHPLDLGVERFASSILAMGIQPYNIRYQADSRNAANFSDKLCRILLDEKENFPFNFAGVKRSHITSDSKYSKPVEVIILDRRTDMITPLTTYWSYESLVDSTLGIGDSGEVNTYVARNFIYDNAFMSESDKADASASRSKLAQKYIVPLSWSTLSTGLFKTISGLDYVSATLAIEKMTHEMKSEEEERKRVREEAGLTLSGKGSQGSSGESNPVVLMKLSAQLADTEKNDTKIRELNNLTRITGALNNKLKICGENQDIELCKRIALLEQQITASTESEAFTFKTAMSEINKMINTMFTARYKQATTPRARIVIGKTLLLQACRLILLAAVTYTYSCTKTGSSSSTTTNNNQGMGGGLSNAQGNMNSNTDSISDNQFQLETTRTLLITELNATIINLIKFLQPIINTVFSSISRTQGIDVIGSSPNEAYEKEYVDIEAACSGLYIALQEVISLFRRQSILNMSSFSITNTTGVSSNSKAVPNDILQSVLVCVPVTPDKIKLFSSSSTKKIGKAINKETALSLSQEAIEVVMSVNETAKKYLSDNNDDLWLKPVNWAAVEAGAEKSLQTLNSYGHAAPVSMQKPEGYELIMERDNNRTLFLHKPAVVSVAEAAIYSNLPENIFPSNKMYLDSLSADNGKQNILAEVQKICTRTTKEVHGVIICVIGGFTVAEADALRMHRVLGTNSQLYRKNPTCYERMAVLTGENTVLCGQFILNKEEAYKGIIGI